MVPTWGNLTRRYMPFRDKKTKNFSILREFYLLNSKVSSLPAFRVSKRTIQRHAANFAFETGISFSCHVLRHTYATLLLEKGVPIEKIQYLLGHRSVNITRHYTQSAFLNVNDLEPTIL